MMLDSTLARRLIVATSLFGVGCGSVADFDDDSGASPDVGGHDTLVPPDSAAESGGDATAGDAGESGSDATKSDAADAGPTACKGLECKVVDCGGATTTTITGTVYAPNGTMPIYGAVVYVPNAPVAPMKAGVQCDRCGTPPSGEPVVIGLTDAKGHFKLENAPADTNLPLVIQVGKWRRQVKLPEVKACVDNPIVDTGLTRLPKNQTEGDMPKIAVTTGACDRLACLLPKLGIDSSEYGVKGSAAAVHFYTTGSLGATDGPAGMTDAKSFWSDVGELSKYDMVWMSCECFEAPTTKDATSFDAVSKYLAAGGRLVTSDYQYLWYKNSPDPDIKSLANIPGGAPTGGSPITLATDFPKAKALASWLTIAEPAAAAGKVTPDYVFDNVQSVDPSKTKTWGTSPSTAGTEMHPRIFSFNVPVGAAPGAQCGKAIHLDAHLNQTDAIDASFPAGCKSPLRDGEAAFAFFAFDLLSCIQSDALEPTPPPRK